MELLNLFGSRGSASLFSKNNNPISSMVLMKEKFPLPAAKKRLLTWLRNPTFNFEQNESSSFHVQWNFLYVKLTKKNMLCIFSKVFWKYQLLIFLVKWTQFFREFILTKQFKIGFLSKIIPIFCCFRSDLLQKIPTFDSDHNSGSLALQPNLVLHFALSLIKYNYFGDI